MNSDFIIIDPISITALLLNIFLSLAIVIFGIFAIVKFVKYCKNASKIAAESAVSSADEIAKFKSLLDSGAITQEEYDKKKNELLNL